jgi:hypothetical protein
MDEQTKEVTEDTQTETTGQTEQEMVSPEEADEDSLKAFLDSVRGDDEEVAPALDEQPEEETTEEKPEEETTPQAATPEEAPKPQEKAKEPQSEETSVAQMKRQLDGLELLLKRRTQDIENLRQQIKAELKPIQERIEGKTHEDQYEAIKDIEAAREKERALAELDVAKEGIESEVESRKIVAAHIKPNDGTLDEMVSCLESDGVPADVLTSFRTNPFSVSRPETLIQVAKRAKAERMLKQMFVVAQALHAENQKLKTKPKAMLDGVQRALKQSPSINGSSGRGVTPDNLSNIPVHKLSDRQLAELAERVRGS